MTTALTDSQALSTCCPERGESSSPSGSVDIKKHVLVGTGAALALLSIYLGVVTLTQGFKHSLEQAASLWPWISLLTTGFGIQVALFSYIRDSTRARKLAATASVTASGGVSTGSMLACCAHHLSDVLPLMGIAGLAGFMARYQTVFLLTGILSNAVGITIMLESIQSMSLSGSNLFRRWDMKYVKKWVTGLALALLAGVSIIKFLL